jgi:hypothetical protein
LPTPGILDLNDAAINQFPNKIKTNENENKKQQAQNKRKQK